MMIHSQEETVTHAVSARRIVVPLSFNETINWEKYLRVEITAFSTPP
jgi:hypothetical protein